MAQLSSIEWTEATWNPVTGCSKVSPGCKNCYADRMSRRLKAMGNHRYRNGFELALQPDLLEAPLRWKTPRMIFVNSMSDLFHPKIPVSFISEVFQVMNSAHWHIFQILTKRSERLAQITKKLRWSKNIWMGISVENADYVYRIEHLKTVDAQIKFISFEPLLGPLSNLPLRGIDWIIVGGESGPRAREIKPEWVRFIRDICLKNKIPFFFKQWGGKQKWKSGRELDGKVWNEMPINESSHNY